MKTKWPPDPALTIAGIAEPLHLVREALEYGTDRAVKHHEARGRAVINPWLYSHVARDDAKNYMINGGIEQMGFKIADLAMSGLYLRGEDVQIRILKIGRALNKDTGQFERGVPVPGHSRVRREYFYQPGFADAGTTLPLLDQPVKLVLLWEQDSSYQLGALELACPRRWDASRNCVDTFWLVPLDARAPDYGAADATDDEPLMLEDLEPREIDDEEQAASDAV